MEEYYGRYSQQEAWQNQNSKRSEDKYPTKQIRLMLDKNLLKQAKEHCDDNHICLTKLTTKALIAYLKNN